MKKKDLRETAEKLKKMYPDVYTAVSFTAEYNMHPRSLLKYEQRCGIYVSNRGIRRGHLTGATFEECFAQL